MRSPAFQVYAKGELTDTAHLSHHEVGLYMRLRCTIWAYTEDYHTCNWDINALASSLQTKPRTLRALVRKLDRPPIRLIIKEKDRIRLPALGEQAVKQDAYRKTQAARSRRRWTTRESAGKASTDKPASEKTPDPAGPDNIASPAAHDPVSTPATASSGAWLPQDRVKWLRIQKPDHRTAWADERRATAIEKHNFKWVVAAYIGAQKLAPPRAVPEDVIRLTFGILRKGTPPDNALDEAARRIRALEDKIPSLATLGERL